MQLIGIDLNKKALQQTESTLKNIPHITIEGNVSDPLELLQNLKIKGITDPENILHIRSFLDHEIPYEGVKDQNAADARCARKQSFISIANDGSLQDNNHIIQRYIEHFSRWAAVTSKHGMVILEVHTLSANIVQRFFSANESFYFDAIHSFSRQNLLDAATFMQVTAEAGLFSDTDFFNRFPRAFPYTRVSLNWFKKKDYIIRNANLKDIDALLNLEELCWAPELIISREELIRRITENPTGNFVIDYQQEVVGVSYTQRIDSEDLLYQTTASQVHQLHKDDGVVFQLLAINIHPEWQHMALGDTMLTYLLRLASLQDSVKKVVGVTRCKNFLLHQDSVTYEQYVNQSVSNGHQIDPILHFHLSHGARILDIVNNYRPADKENEGNGVLIGYTIRDEIKNTQSETQTATNKHKVFEQYSDMELDQAITERLKKLLGQKKISHYHPNISFKDMGMDSLDLTELREIINRLFNTRLDAAIFFRFSTPASIIEHLNNIKNQSIKETKQVQPAINNVVNKPSPLLTQISQPKYTIEDYQANINDKDIALVGMSCRFPQGINDKESFWQFLQSSDEVITRIPEERWDATITDNVKGASFGGFLKDISLFDAAFFGISPREAINMDPQQRLLLETSWQAFEDAGIDPQKLKGSNTGVFIGHFGHDYESLQIKAYSYEDFQSNFSTGTSASVQAGRLSYFYDFHGPAISLNTACSSTLAAVHMAARSLHLKECDVAIAGGANLILTPELNLVFGRANMLSAEGKCKTFDASADGYVRSEGCAFVVLKRIKDAINAGETILAIIKGSAINQDGASNGITAPNGQAQEAVINSALAQSNISSNEITYLETHGTGTSLGDPVEVEALVNVFADNHSVRSSPLVLGSVKSRIGHTEAVAGLASLIKSALILNHRVIPPMSIISTINPLVNKQLQRISATINTTAIDIPTEQTVARIGISSFGYSGTNVHMILEEAPRILTRKVIPQPSLPLPFLISAKTKTALQKQAAKLHSWLSHLADFNLIDLAASLATTRSHFNHRAIMITEQPQVLLENLADLAQGKSSEKIRLSEINPIGKLVLLFTGQGSQYAGMGYACYQQFPLFRQVFDEICTQLDALMTKQQQPSLRDIIFAESGGTRSQLLNQTIFTQPALFALEVALFRLVESWGIQPDLLCGHSIGAISAAHVSGVLSLQDACVLVAARAQLMQAQRTDGAMVSIQASEAEIEPYLIGHENEVSIAALNGPLSTVIAGDESIVIAIAEQFSKNERRTTRLTVSHAFHSPHMDGMLNEFQQILSGLTFHAPKIPIISNLTGKLSDTTLLCSADYWVRHVRSTVRFSTGIVTAKQSGATTFLEIGPQGILTSMARACLNKYTEDEDNEAVLITSLSGQNNDVNSLMNMLATLHLQRYTINWNAVFATYSPKRMALPTYAFQRQHYWVDIPNSNNQLSTLTDHSLRYELAWKVLDNQATQNLSGNLLLLVPDNEDLAALADKLSQILSDHDATVTLQYCKNAQADLFSIHAKLNELSENPQIPTHILSLLAFDEQPYIENNDLPAGFALNIQLLQILNHIKRPISCWLVTHNAVAVEFTEPLNHPLQALNWGLARTAALEYPNRDGGIIDLPEQINTTALTQLINILSSPGLENQWAIRTDKIYTPRLQHTSPNTPVTNHWKPRGTVLVTGGNGAIGEHLTHWLCHLKAKHIVLISRRGLDPHQQKRLSEYAGSTTKLTVEQCDIADRQATSELLSRLVQNGDQISSVFHAAGIMDTQSLNDISLKQLSTTIAGKVLGARNLSELLSNTPLDAFVLFSSIASVWGSGQQTGYSAANAYLDALTIQRRSQGLPCTTVAWGVWQGKGMGTEKMLQERLQHYGVHPLSPTLAISMLQESLDKNLIYTIVANMDWAKFALYYSLARPRLLLSDLPEVQPMEKTVTTQNTSTNQRENHSLATELQKMSKKERITYLLSVVLDNTATVLGIKQVTDIAPDIGFFNLGLNSIMAVELRERLQKVSGVKLPTTLVFDYPTPRAAAKLLDEKLQPVKPSASNHHDEEYLFSKSTPETEYDSESNLLTLNDDELLAAANSLLKGEK